MDISTRTSDASLLPELPPEVWVEWFQLSYLSKNTYENECVLAKLRRVCKLFQAIVEIYPTDFRRLGFCSYKFFHEITSPLASIQLFVSFFAFKYFSGKSTIQFRNIQPYEVNIIRIKSGLKNLPDMFLTKNSFVAPLALRRSKGALRHSKDNESDLIVEEYYTCRQVGVLQRLVFANSLNLKSPFHIAERERHIADIPHSVQQVLSTLLEDYSIEGDLLCALYVGPASIKLYDLRTHRPVADMDFPFTLWHRIVINDTCPLQKDASGRKQAQLHFDGRYIAAVTFDELLLWRINENPTYHFTPVVMENPFTATHFSLSGGKFAIGNSVKHTIDIYQINKLTTAFVNKIVLTYSFFKMILKSNILVATEEKRAHLYSVYENSNPSHSLTSIDAQYPIGTVQLSLDPNFPYLTILCFLPDDEPSTLSSPRGMRKTRSV